MHWNEPVSIRIEVRRGVQHGIAGLELNLIQCTFRIHVDHGREDTVAPFLVPMPRQGMKVEFRPAGINEQFVDIEKQGPVTVQKKVANHMAPMGLVLLVRLGRENPRNIVFVIQIVAGSIRRCVVDDDEMVNADCAVKPQEIG